MDGTRGVYQGKPHKRQVQRNNVFNTLFPETAVKHIETGVKWGNYKNTKTPCFPSAKAMKKAQAEIAKKSKANLKHDGVPASIQESANTRAVNHMREAMRLLPNKTELPTAPNEDILERMLKDARTKKF